MSKRPPSRGPRPPRRAGEAPPFAKDRPLTPPRAEGRPPRPVPDPRAPARPPGAITRADEPVPHGGLWLYGRHAVLAAIANPERRIERLVAMTLAAPDLEAARTRATASRPRVEILDRAPLERLIGGGRDEAAHQGVAALVQPLADLALPDLLDTLAPGQPAVVAVLDQVSDPRNVGAILRSAAAFGVLGVLVQERHAPPVTAALAKAASGALESVPLVRVVNIARALDALRHADFVCLGLAADARQSLAASLAANARPARLALVLGAEDKGLRRLVREHCDALARIPIVTAHPSASGTLGGDDLPAIDSLNVSVAAALAFYEAKRG